MLVGIFRCNYGRINLIFEDLQLQNMFCFLNSLGYVFHIMKNIHFDESPWLSAQNV